MNNLIYVCFGLQQVRRWQRKMLWLSFCYQSPRHKCVCMSMYLCLSMHEVWCCCIHVYIKCVSVCSKGRSAFQFTCLWACSHEWGTSWTAVYTCPCAVRGVPTASVFPPMTLMHTHYAPLIMFAIVLQVTSNRPLISRLLAACMYVHTYGIILMANWPWRVYT